eukprot:scaffold27503_cov23-Tisochrysis_lutea.AAC.2
MQATFAAAQAGVRDVLLLLRDGRGCGRFAHRLAHQVGSGGLDTTHAARAGGVGGWVVRAELMKSMLAADEECMCQRDAGRGRPHLKSAEGPISTKST